MEKTGSIKRRPGMLSVVVWSLLAAQGVAEVRKDKELPKSGTLSATVQSGQAVNVAAEPFGFDDNNAGAVAPLTGSVSRQGVGYWRARVFNNSQTDTYSAHVELLQRNERKVVVRRDAFTYTIGPKSEKSEVVSEGVGVRGAELNLLSYKNLTAQRAKREASAIEQSKRTPTPIPSINPRGPVKAGVPPVVTPSGGATGKAEWSITPPRKRSSK